MPVAGCCWPYVVCGWKVGEFEKLVMIFWVRGLDAIFWLLSCVTWAFISLFRFGRCQFLQRKESTTIRAERGALLPCLVLYYLCWGISSIVFLRALVSFLFPSGLAWPALAFADTDRSQWGKNGHASRSLDPSFFGTFISDYRGMPFCSRDVSSFLRVFCIFLLSRRARRVLRLAGRLALFG